MSSEETRAFIGMVEGLIAGRKPEDGCVVLGMRAWRRYTNTKPDNVVEYKGFRLEPRELSNDFLVAWENAPGLSGSSDWREKRR